MSEIKNSDKANRAETRNLRRSNRRMKTWLVILPVFLFLLGWLLGSFVPLPFSQAASQTVNNAIPLSSDEKFENILQIMTKDWFFADEIEDVTGVLQDNAYYGMTSNEIDPHTAYMSSEEITNFTQSINRNFIGIGVQFRSTADGLHVVERVIRNTPAEEYGVQAGDIIYAVEGVNVSGMTSTEVADLVKGEEGTPVTIDFLRGGKTVTLKIIRRAISSTTYGQLLDEQTGYLEIQQFGETTGDECRTIMEEFVSRGITRVIIDLRDDGGGYLSALQNVMGCFVEDGTVVMRQEYSDGTVTEIKSHGKPFEQIEKCVLLINANTASAAEVFTLAMKELRPETETVGVLSYGKGTVQITRMFDDGSALKYTTSKWTSPSGVWVNKVGITPDHEVKQHDVYYETFPAIEDGEEFGVDSVSDFTRLTQVSLDFLDYEIDRTDGYLSENTSACILEYQKEHDLEVTGTVNAQTYKAVLSQVILSFSKLDERDYQLTKAMEVIHE